MVPYRGTRYHLKEWLDSPNPPKDPAELFNLRHSIKRAKAEIGIGLLKGRFRVLRQGIETWSVDQARAITMACAHLHNYIQNRHHATASVRDLIVEEVARQANDLSVDEAADLGDGTGHFGSFRGAANAWRDQCADRAWAQYQIYVANSGTLFTHDDREELARDLSELRAAQYLNGGVVGAQFYE